MIAGCVSPATGSEASGRPSIPSVAAQHDWLYFGIGDMHAPLGSGCMDLDALADVSQVLPGTFAILELQGHARAMLGDSLDRAVGRVRVREAARAVQALRQVDHCSQIGGRIDLQPPSVPGGRRNRTREEQCSTRP